MEDTPNYSFYRRPRFSANHLAEYLCTRDAGQRDAVIRKAKFPRKPSVTAYQQVTPAFRSFLAKPTGGFGPLDELIDRLNAKALREEGYNREEALRCVKAVDAFKAAYSAAKWGKAEFVAGPQDVSMKIEGVSVNVRLDPPLIERGADQAFGGGCVIFLASTPDARKNIEERRRYVAAITHWALEGGNLEPLPRLCMSFDVFGEEIIRAPTAVSRLRQKMTDSCREIHAKWDAIEPPTGYDGPDWR
ncbi:MAG TPA: hypothetical protein VFE18_07765 [Phenylobacterium sp.]|jgi:hypothetical protein|uniref:hypothetical protein n=1 Tax=Phenylobacterium sp. TaxID=1871053 RepID=UPI002D259664|nr:hypothetical protein [Phenylobacterium sp.]HZZ68056.1 hypothetical protein [Phenylobacterium sp.]